jgi:DNA helicase HerA-like ATPase
MNTPTIGKVTATESKPTSCNTVRFWVHKDIVIKPFDIVRIKHIPLKNGEEASYSYALVQDLQYMTDSAGHLANYVSSDFGDLNAEPINERLGTTVAEAEVLFNTKDIEMPIRDGAAVEWADKEGIKEALGLNQLRHPIPAGYISMSNNEEVPIEFDAAYLVGPEGAHLNIAGISGLATKTSYAMFLLNSIQQRMPEKAALIIFNVKGKDLLSIDKPIENLDANGVRSQQQEWAKCGLSPIPFRDVTYLYPYDNKAERNFTNSHVDPDILRDQIEREITFNYFYDVENGKEKIPLLFSDVEDPNSTLEAIFHQVVEDIEADDWNSLRNQVRERTEKGHARNKEIPVVSWRKFSRLLRTRTSEHSLFTNGSENKERRHKLTRDAVLALRPGRVLVIDIEPLPDYLQCLVVGDVIQTVLGIKLGDEEIEPDELGTVVVFADELNKYGPKSSGSSDRSLTRSLLEITERGRSLGLVLFGAEQFRSGVHDRILGNCSTNVYGRTSPVEIRKSQDYRYFPDVYKSAITRLPQGTLLLQHPIFKTSLLKARFPSPCYYQPK